MRASGDVFDSCARRAPRHLSERSPGSSRPCFGDANAFAQSSSRRCNRVLSSRNRYEDWQWRSGPLLSDHRQIRLPVRSPPVSSRDRSRPSAPHCHFQPGHLPRHLLVRLEILPAVRRSDVAGGSLDPRDRACQRQRRTPLPLREQKRCPFKFTDPGSIASTSFSRCSRTGHGHDNWTARLSARKSGPVATLRLDGDPRQSPSRCDSRVHGRYSPFRMPVHPQPASEPWIPCPASLLKKKSTPSVTMNPISRTQALSMCG